MRGKARRRASTADQAASRRTITHLRRRDFVNNFEALQRVPALADRRPNRPANRTREPLPDLTRDQPAHRSSTRCHKSPEHRGPGAEQIHATSR